jgi:hypothetical protein
MDLPKCCGNVDPKRNLPDGVGKWDVLGSGKFLSYQKQEGDVIETRKPVEMRKPIYKQT